MDLYTKTKEVAGWRHLIDWEEVAARGPKGRELAAEAILTEYEAMEAIFTACNSLASMGSVKDQGRYKKVAAEVVEGFRPLRNISLQVGEEKICAIFDHAVRSGINFITPSLNGIPTSILREVRVGSGVADRVVEMEDGSAVVVEMKGPGSRRDHALGLGQVILYASAIRESGKYHDVRMMLVVGGDHDTCLAAACRTVGVGYVAIKRDEVEAFDRISLRVRGIA